MAVQLLDDRPLDGAALAFGLKILLSERYDDFAFVLPYLALFALDAICLLGFIVPYFRWEGVAYGVVSDSFCSGFSTVTTTVRAPRLSLRMSSLMRR